MSRQDGVSGALVVDKPEGPTSHDVVAHVRRTLRTRVGHTGTLDPLATGVLGLLLGRATRLMPYYGEDEKVYLAVVRLGVATDTYDREGAVTSQKDPPEASSEQCRDVLERFQGEIQQQPPLYSAVRVGGERLYQAARRGEIRPRPTRTVQVHSIELLERSAEKWTLRVRCSSGTYIRSLAHDIGEVLGCGAHLERLRREVSGDFDLERAVDPSQPEEVLRESVIPLEGLLPRLPRVDLTDVQARRARHGNAVTLGWTPPEAPAYRLFEQDELVAVARPRLAQLQPSVVLRPYPEGA